MRRAFVFLAALLGRATALVGVATLTDSSMARRVNVVTRREVLRPLRRTVYQASQTSEVASYVLSYKDCAPFDEHTLEGRFFLATNLAFYLTGAVMSTSSPALGALCEMAGTCSIGYHWAQLRVGGTSHPTVQTALLLDYLCALPTVVFGMAYAASAVSAGADVPLAAGACGLASFVCFIYASLPACHEPRRYMLVHGLWHVLGAFTGYLLATSAVP
tara:strand:- start:1276 stop:1926 length:651 start_codon:yes stop_codon:yes gene_type:complete